MTGLVITEQGRQKEVQIEVEVTHDSVIGTFYSNVMLHQGDTLFLPDFRAEAAKVWT